MRTDEVCLPTFDAHATGGIEQLHPMRVDFEEAFARVGGGGFDDVVAKAVRLPPLSAHLPQVEWLPRLKSERIQSPALGVRLDEVFRYGRIRSARELRGCIGVPAATEIVLLLFTRDALLEKLAEGGQALLQQVAEGGYALVLPPSYSLWQPRRRPDNLLSLRRSLLMYEALQDRGVPSIPRVGWVESIDVERWANWVNANAPIAAVSLDLMTYGHRSFDRQVGLLASFDELTGSRLHYLVNGVRATVRITALYQATSPTRMTVSDATMARVPSASGTFAARATEIEDRCVRARELLAAVAAGQSVEGFLAQIDAEYSRSLDQVA